MFSELFEIARVLVHLNHVARSHRTSESERHVCGGEFLVARTEYALIPFAPGSQPNSEFG